jgi:protocatechuate 3,4-dioxygenase beta subunit
MQEQQTTMRESRRAFIMRAAMIGAALPAASLGAWALKRGTSAGPVQAQASGQEWRGAADAPAQLSWRTVITSPNEPGEPLVMSGRIFQPDGRTPAAGVLLFVYHTDARGYYNQPNKLPARLRGWIRTGADGRYEFRTIKPAPYPNADVPAHIHTTLSAPGYPEYWIDSYWFAGDPFITSAQRATLSGRGGFNNIVGLLRDKDDVWYGRRDIRLERVC